MTKEQCRKVYKEKRMSLPENIRLGYDKAICAGLKQLNLETISAVHVYMPIQKLNEPDLSCFVHFLRGHFSQVQLVVSKTDFENHRMHHYLWDSSTVFEENSWGIKEPVDGLPFDEKKIDLVIIPLLIADRKGNRVGYGKGFYDRFLAVCRPDVKKVGVSYFEPIKAIEDVSKQDVPLDILITPLQAHFFK